MGDNAAPKLIRDNEVLLAALRDAVHFASTREPTTVSDENLLSAVVHVYSATGLQEKEAMVLLAESVDRWTDRFIEMAREAGIA